MKPGPRWVPEVFETRWSEVLPVWWPHDDKLFMDPQTPRAVLGSKETLRGRKGGDMSVGVGLVLQEIFRFKQVGMKMWAVF